MFYFDYLVVILLGLSFGSFANVCINRLPYQISIIPPSRCPNCKSKIQYFDNIPILSYFILSGISRCCNKKISLQYPIVEFVIMLFGIVIFYYLGRSLDSIFIFIFILSLIIIFVTDLKDFIIPNIISYLMIILGIILSFLKINPLNTLATDSLIGGIISGLIFYTISKIFIIIRKKEGLGMGDVKMISMVGFWVGLESILIIITLSSILGLIFAFSFVAFKKIDFSQYIPFGCFISIGTIITVYIKIVLQLNFYSFLI